MPNISREWLYSPRSIAVVGASHNPKKIGHRFILSLKRGGYKGAVYPINPAGGEVAGFPAVNSIGEMPNGVDLVVLAVPAQASIDSLRALAGKGVRGAVVIASGFSETPNGVQLEQQLNDLARKNDIRLVGPNTEGVIDFDTSFVGSFGSGFTERPYAAKVAVVSQSGGFTGQLYRLLDERGIACSRIISTGNEADLGVADFVADAAECDEISGILLYMESIRHAKNLLGELKRLKGRKPVLVMKAGRTSTGASAALSHTGAIAGNYHVMRDVFRQFGAIFALSIDELADCAVGAAHLGGRSDIQPGIAVLSQSGGVAVELADLLHEAGLPLPALNSETRNRIQEFIPSYGAVRNPVDMTASVLEKPELVARVLEAAADDQGIGAALICLTDASNPELWSQLVMARDRLSIPVVLAWLGDRSESGTSWGHVRHADWPRVLSSRGAVAAMQTIFAAAAARNLPRA